ncbi:hypothetical protein B1B_09524 [mine drainage metagenome]|uniref:Uncharacterized protein n=1 Tax=mine drainage metagenome TaxID=410659 RepID=T1ACH9_9ZZZZ
MGRPPFIHSMAEGSSSGEPIDVLLAGTRDLLRPEEIVRDATRDIIKDEIRHHIEKSLKEDPELARDLRESVRQLLEARALEYAALLQVGTCTARLGLSTLPESVRKKLREDIAKLLTRELGGIVEQSL